MLGAGQARAQDITSNLIARWTLDDTAATTTVIDSAGTYTGTMTSMTGAANTAAGQIGTALNFDGSADYITTADINAIDGATQLTISFWIKASSLAANQIIISKYNGTNGLVIMTSNVCGGSNDIEFYADVATSGAYGCTQGDFHATGVWEHWVIVYDGTAAVGSRDKIYYNGVSRAVGLGTSPPTAMGSNTATLNIAKHPTGGPADPTFPGLIDDVRIYTRALTDADVAALYSYRECSNPAAAAGDMIYNSTSNVIQYCNGTSWRPTGKVDAAAGSAGCSNPTGDESDIIYNSTYNKMQFCNGAAWISMGDAGSTAGYASTSGLVGYWDFEENGGTTSTDRSGNGNLVSFPGGGSNPAWSAGNNGYGLTFTRSQDDYISRSSGGTTSLNGLANFTLSAWINYTTASEYTGILLKGGEFTTGFNYFMQATDNNKLTCGFMDAPYSSSANYAYTTSTANISGGTWKHVACTYDGTTIRGYINGVADGTYASPISPTLSGTNDFTIGGGDSATGGTMIIDEARVYNRALSAAEIATIYNPGASTCTSPTGVAGDLIYNTTSNQMQYCNGLAWISMAPVKIEDCAGLGSAQTTDSSTGHCYFLSSSAVTQPNAKTGCASSGAYLATITSGTESALLSALITGNDAWFGAEDSTTEGAWLWMTGPEAGQQFWSGGWAGGGGGVPVGGLYNNWNPGVEPNNSAGGAGEDCAVLGYGGATTWVDEGCANTKKYICEKGGI
jgi:hypothetical protein